MLPRYIFCYRHLDLVEAKPQIEAHGFHFLFTNSQFPRIPISHIHSLRQLSQVRIMTFFLPYIGKGFAVLELEIEIFC